MTDSPSNRHNRLAAEFVQKVGRETSNGAELMVVVESTMLASMLLLVKVYGTDPSHASTERPVGRGSGTTTTGCPSVSA